MENIILISTAQTLFIAAAAILLVWFLLRVLDRASGSKFRVIYAVIIQNPQAAALYFGLRFVGACLLVGLSL